MRSYRQLAPGLTLALALLAPNARASSACESEAGASAREQAKAHYSAGISAYQEQHYREAIDELSCANQLLKDAAFSYNIAVSYEAMGDAPSALRWYRDHAREGGAEVDTPALRTKLAELEAKLQSRGVQQVTVLSEPSGAILSIDDQPSGLTPFDMELKPGRHRYRLTSTGHEAAEGWFELRADRALDVRVTLSATPEAQRSGERATAPELPPAHLAPSVPQPSRSELPPAADPPGTFAAIGTWTWVSIGSGVALLGGSLGFEWRRRQLEDTLGSSSQVEYQQHYDAMATQQTSSRILAGLGSAALITGGVLAVLDLSRSAPKRELHLTACAGSELCLAASGAF
jgi:hypothetical protein